MRRHCYYGVLQNKSEKLLESKSDIPISTAGKKNSLQKLSVTHQKNTDVCSTFSGTKISDLLKQCARVDRVIKGRAYGDPWRELLQLSLATRISV